MVNRAAISLLADIRGRAGQPPEAFVISGCIGARGDGHRASEMMTAAEAESYPPRASPATASSSARPGSTTTKWMDSEFAGAPAFNFAGLFAYDSDGKVTTKPAVPAAADMGRAP